VQRPAVRRFRSRGAVAAIVVLAALLACLPSTGAGAVQATHNAVVSANPADFTPHVVDGQVNAIAPVGGTNTVVVGGTFTLVRRAGTTATLTRNHLFAFDRSSGAISTSFAPLLNGPVETLAVAPDGRSVYVGGAFGSVNGATTHRRLVRLNLGNGQLLTAFSANTNTIVQEVLLRGGWLYVGGKFTTIRSTPRSGLARVDPTTGAVDPNLDLPFTDAQLGTMGVPEIDVTPDGSRLVALGNFSRVNGLERVQVAMLNLATTPVSVAPWHTLAYPVLDPADPNATWCNSRFPSWVRDVDLSPDGSYFVVVTTGANRPNRLCDTAAPWETSATGTNLQPTWVNWTGGDSLTAVGVTGAAVYVGGHPQWVNNPYIGVACGVCPGPGPGGVPREGIAALDPVNGLPFTWNPGRARNVGVYTFVGTGDGLWVGSDSDRLGGENHPKLGFLPLAGGVAVPPNTPSALPGNLFAMDMASGNLVRRSYNLTTFGPATTVPAGVDWRNARGAFALNGRLYSGTSDGRLHMRTFDGTTAGAATDVNLHGLEVAPPAAFTIPGTTQPIPAFTTHLQNMTGMFFQNGRIYYTVQGDSRLYYRYFTPQSQVVGSNLFVASTGDGVDWAGVRGMTMASGRLIYATTDGRLWRVGFGGGRPTGAVTQIGGPGVDAANWAARGLFVLG
jgi:beta-propeller uncharacterized protein DUF5122